MVLCVVSDVHERYGNCAPHGWNNETTILCLFIVNCLCKSLKAQLSDICWQLEMRIVTIDMSKVDALSVLHDDVMSYQVQCFRFSSFQVDTRTDCCFLSNWLQTQSHQWTKLKQWNEATIERHFCYSWQAHGSSAENCFHCIFPSESFWTNCKILTFCTFWWRTEKHSSKLENMPDPDAMNPVDLFSGFGSNIPPMLGHSPKRNRSLQQTQHVICNSFGLASQMWSRSVSGNANFFLG